MADKIDPLDVGALERSVNDSATRVSAIWLTFVAFSAYLAAAASTVSHRQLLLEEAIKLPTVNIDVPLVVSAVLLPSLFVVYHVYVLLQVVLLARTADAYNSAVNVAVADAGDQVAVRQRLANTLFAQLFAGSAREREGVLGWLLRIMAWVTLAVAPPLVLIVFQLQFLPYHSAAVTWSHRLLVAIDLLMVLILWAGAVDPRSDISWRRIPRAPTSTSLAAVVIAFSFLALTFPGERHAGWTRYEILHDLDLMYGGDPTCHQKSYLVGVLSPYFDRIAVVGEQMVDGDKLRRIDEIAGARSQKPYEGERTRSLRGRDLHCGNLGGVDLRRADFTGADLSGANLTRADLDGAKLAGASLRWAALDGARLSNASLEGVDLSSAGMSSVRLQNANLNKAIIGSANLEGAELTGAELDHASLQGARVSRVRLQRASMKGTRLAGADLRNADLSGANLEDANLEHATLINATLTGANLKRASLHGASLMNATLRGADLRMATLSGANLTKAWLEGASLDYAQLRGAILSEAQLQGASLYRATLSGATAKKTRFDGAILVETQLQGVDFEYAYFDHAVIERAFLWRASRGECKRAEVNGLDFKRVINVALDAQTSSGPKFEPATSSTISKWIDETLKSLREESREGRRIELNEQFADLPKREADLLEEQWVDCEKFSESRGITWHSKERAAYFLKTFCEVEQRDTPAVHGLFRNWLATESLRNWGGARNIWQQRGFLGTVARGLLEKSCAGGAGLTEEMRGVLQSILKWEQER
jgi:uncharacterized protein YjbI with pentapeptide repeats